MFGLGGLYEGIDMAKVMMGDRAFQLPLNFILQRNTASPENHSVTGVFQTRAGVPLFDKTTKDHIILLGDVIIRPHLAIASDAFYGMGIGGLYRDGFIEMDKWIKTGDILLPPIDGFELTGDRAAPLRRRG